MAVSNQPQPLGDLVDENFAKLPERDQELHRWALSIHSDRPTPEMAARCFSEVAQRDKFSYRLGNKPLIVISTMYDSPGYAELQRRLLMLSRNSKQFIAQNSTHMVIIDELEIVVKAIERVAGAIREGKPVSDSQIERQRAR